MNKYRLKGQQLAAIFIMGCLLFNYPLLLIFSRNTLVWGVPLLYLYVFVSWALMIGLMIIIIERHK
jgi:Na+-driven multidrug efflux pump